MSKPENPPAFPVENAATNNFAYSGMTLRDYFAGQALIHCEQLVTGAASAGSKMAAAQYCYEIADAMLAERSKSK